ncbi:unnamed protein product [Medioppia subpectinata]|uniref:Uncharacterized protein n=1 Tax=Medioppia subpectinata TaxID=1979941 RepID=A0A7R9KYT5_9ACAR|nr:unnamed protein product [Medioppia subpectinata]CAG2111194.1 unnamed protein product [Medioppia subpectinata]
MVKLLDYDQRMQILQQSQTAYFICIVVCQWMDVICSKTRRQLGTQFQHMFRDGTMPWVWLCGLPFFIYLMCYEELRKFLIRRYPDSWLGKELLI